MAWWDLKTKTLVDDEGDLVEGDREEARRIKREQDLLERLEKAARDAEIKPDSKSVLKRTCPQCKKKFANGRGMRLHLRLWCTEE